jgi:small-conductance mechanosensitive channel
MSDFLTAGFWLTAGHTALRLVLIIAGAACTLHFFRLLADRFFTSGFEAKSFYMEEKRARTLSRLIQSMVRYMIYFIAIVMVLQEFHIDTTSIIAGAGIIGLAIGVGAQSLIRDFITGFFIILEDQYAVGDYIVSGDMAGTVEEIGLRVTKLRDGSGILHIIPHGAVSRVSNYTRGHMLAVVNVPVAYEADVDSVRRVLDEACVMVGKSMAEVLEGPTVQGIVDFRPGELVIRLTAKTVPLEQVKVETALRYTIKRLLVANGIPYPAVLPAKQNEGGKE